MTYFPDLELCYYHSGPYHADSWTVPLLAIGWLEHPYPFPLGVAPEGLLPVLVEMSHRSAQIYSWSNFLGLHDCSLCIAEGCSSFRLRESHRNIFVPGLNSVYIAPAGIIHYIELHSYLPPSEFIEVVLTCPEYGSPEYQEALRMSNAGNATPLQINDEVIQLNPSSCQQNP